MELDYDMTRRLLYTFLLSLIASYSKQETSELDMMFNLRA